MSKPNFKRKDLIAGESIIFEGENDQSIIANKMHVAVQNVKLETTADLNEFAKVLSSAWLDHQALAQGTKTMTNAEKKLDPLMPKPIQTDFKKRLSN